MHHLKEKSISIDVRMINSSGIGSYIKSFLSFIYQDFKKVVLLGDQSEILKFYNQNLPENIEIIHTDIKIYSLKEKFIFPFLIPKVDYHFTPHFNTPILPIKAKEQFCTIHDINHIANKHTVSFVSYFFAKINIYVALFKSKFIMVDSEFTKKEIIKYFGKWTKNKLHTIHIAVQSLTPNNIKSIYSKPFILFVGNVKPHKNLKNLVKAYNQSNIKNDIDLVIVGKKDGFITSDNEVEKLVNNQKNIIFTGYINDETLTSLYQNTLFFVFPTLYEGFGLPPLEAMSLGVPVIGSNIPVVQEICGDAIYYFDPNNIEEIANKIDIFANDLELRNNLKTKGFEQIKLYSKENFKSNFNKLLNKYLD